MSKISGSVKTDDVNVSLNTISVGISGKEASDGNPQGDQKAKPEENPTPIHAKENDMAVLEGPTLPPLQPARNPAPRQKPQIARIRGLSSNPYAINSDIYHQRRTPAGRQVYLCREV